MGIAGFVGAFAAVYVGVFLKPVKLNLISIGLVASVSLYYLVLGYTKFYLTSNRYMDWYNSYFYPTASGVDWSYWNEQRFYL